MCKTIIAAFLLLITNINIFSQSKKIDQLEIKELIASSSKLLKKYYVSEKVGIKIGDLLKKKYQDGFYDNLIHPKELAEELTTDLRSINGDHHLSINYVPKQHLSQNKVTKKDYKEVNHKGKWTNYGFQEVKILEGNIGYLKISHFSDWSFFKETKEVITSTFKVLENTDALIIDVINNRGGYENIVAYLISYLYEGKPIHLSDYYVRFNNSKNSLWTKETIPGKRLSKTPVYVLVNAYTASAGESLAYMLKHLKRATVIGEKTMGAGHGAMTHKATDHFKITISSEETINAVTKTSFEGIGVQPNIAVSSEKAFSEAYRLALVTLKRENKSTIEASNYDNIIKFSPLFKNEMKVIDYKIYIGRYKSSNLEIIISQKEEQLYAEMVGKGGVLKLIPKSKNIFLVEGVKERIEFILNEKNKVVKLKGLDSPMELLKVTTLAE